MLRRALGKTRADRKIRVSPRGYGLAKTTQSTKMPLAQKRAVAATGSSISAMRRDYGLPAASIRDRDPRMNRSCSKRYESEAIKASGQPCQRRSQGECSVLLDLTAKTHKSAARFEVDGNGGRGGFLFAYEQRRFWHR